MSILNPINLIPPQYKILALVVVLFLVVGGLFGGGYKVGHTYTKNHYVAIISEMNAKESALRADKADLQSKLTAEISNIKEKIVTKYVDKIKVITEKEYVYVEQAKNDVPSQYDLSTGWVSVHNNAARTNTTDSDSSTTTASDATPSGIRDNQALETVTANYAACHKNSEQLSSLQEYVKEVQQVVDRFNEQIRKRNAQ